MATRYCIFWCWIQNEFFLDASSYCDLICNFIIIIVNMIINYNLFVFIFLLLNTCCNKSSFRFLTNSLFNLNLFSLFYFHLFITILTISTCHFDNLNYSGVLLSSLFLSMGLLILHFIVFCGVVGISFTFHSCGHGGAA